MNGNNILRKLLAGSLVMLFFQSCFIFSTGGGSGGGNDRNRGGGDDPIDTIAEVDTTFREDTTIFEPQKVWKVGIMLPFSIDDRFINEFDMANRGIPYRPLVALELYEGMLMALEDLEAKGFRFDVHVFDTRNDSFEVLNLLRKPIMADLDIIFGPLFTANVRVVSRFARSNEIFLVSPLAADFKLPNANPFLILGSPSVEAHCAALTNHIGDHYDKNRIILMHQGDPRERRLSDDIKAAYTRNGTLLYRNKSISQVDIGADGEFTGDDLSPTDTTIIIVPSFDEGFVLKVTRQLNRLSRDYPLVLYGMPNWIEKFGSLRLDYLNNLKFHYSSPTWANGTATYLEVDRRYRQTFGMKASSYVLKGYDLVSGLCSLIGNYGTDMTKQFHEIANYSICHPLRIEGNYNKFDIRKKGPPNNFENKHVYILRYANYELHPRK